MDDLHEITGWPWLRSGDSPFQGRTSRPASMTWMQGTGWLPRLKETTLEDRKQFIHNRPGRAH
jgi:hypothetical protein